MQNEISFLCSKIVINKKNTTSNASLDKVSCKIRHHNFAAISKGAIASVLLNIVGKEHFPSLYSPAKERALTSRNIKAGWAASGLFPFNPDRVLRDTPKPVTALTVPKAYEVEVGPCPQGEVPQTPVTSEALTSLHNLIKQDAHRLDETSKQRLQRHLQKFANAAQTSFAERALLRDQIRFLSRMNNEAKVRRSTKSVVLGKAKVTSYEDIEEARAKRAAKEEATAGKGKRGRERKSPATEAGAPEPKAKVARMSEAQVAEDEIAA